MNEQRYHVEDVDQIISPALVVFRETLDENLDEMVRIAKDPSRLRPHCKTHKMTQVVQLQLERGITRHKCATFAEAEMLVAAGVTDVLLAYNLVGPNMGRAVDFMKTYPGVAFGATADHAEPIAQLGQVMTGAGMTIDLLLDMDTGQHRTGVVPGAAAGALYKQIADTAGLVPGGLHIYDGQNHQTDLAERQQAVEAAWQSVAVFRDDLVASGYPVPRMVAGGSGSFPIYAEIDDPTIELSPGTTTFFDRGYGQMFPDLDFTPAARILTRVISCPTSETVTLDLGYKACASDPPAGRRLMFPQLPDAEEILQNEEHLVLKTNQASELRPGDWLLAIPRHICPTTALHQQVYVVTGNRLQETWPVAARDRKITV